MSNIELGDRRKRIADKVPKIDGEAKALTGRTAEMYALGSGIKQSELFPEGKMILNIGDPWQTLDLPGVVTLEYESGDEAEFVDNLEKIEKIVLNYVNSLRTLVDESCQNLDKESVETRELYELLTQAPHEQQELFSEQTDKAIEMYRHITYLIAYIFGRPLQNCWYTANRIWRQLENYQYIKHVIEPELEREVRRRKAMSHEDMQQLRQELISAFRDERRYTQAESVKGIFPDTPFEDHEFDRIVASWSISTHMFEVLEDQDFSVYWNEIDRLLKRDGVAYMWPLYNALDQEQAMVRSLFAYRKRGGDAAFVMHDGGIRWVDDDEFGYTMHMVQALAVFPRGASKATKQRLMESVLQYPDADKDEYGLSE